MIIAGITHPCGMNNAACILVDGKLIAFCEEERFNRVKHSPYLFPVKAIEFCLKSVGIKPSDVDQLAI